MDLKILKPENKSISGKYSWNLYKFLETNQGLKVYWCKINSFSRDRYDFEQRKETNAMQHFFLGKKINNSYVGRYLGSILTKNNKDLYAYSWLNDNDLEDVTDLFFDTYEKIGRCIFDINHNLLLAHEDSRYNINGDTRKCNWCDAEFKKEIKEVVTKQEVWVRINK